MKNLAHKLITVIFSLFPIAATAGYYRIVNIEEDSHKIYRTEPRQICNYERSRSDRIGNAVIGGLIGNQFGRGNGRRAATIGGAAIGYNYGRNQYNCRTEYVRTYRHVVRGYIVYYDYYGSLKTTYVTNYPRGYEIYIPY